MFGWFKEICARYYTRQVLSEYIPADKLDDLVAGRYPDPKELHLEEREFDIVLIDVRCTDLQSTKTTVKELLDLVFRLHGMVHSHQGSLVVVTFGCWESPDNSEDDPTELLDALQLRSDVRVIHARRNGLTGVESSQHHMFLGFVIRDFCNLLAMLLEMDYGQVVRNA